MLRFLQRFDLLLRRYAETFQAFHPAHHVATSIVKLLSCLVEGTRKEATLLSCRFFIPRFILLQRF